MYPTLNPHDLELTVYPLPFKLLIHPTVTTVLSLEDRPSSQVTTLCQVPVFVVFIFVSVILPLA